MLSNIIHKNSNKFLCNQSIFIKPHFNENILTYFSYRNFKNKYTPVTFANLVFVIKLKQFTKFT